MRQININQNMSSSFIIDNIPIPDIYSVYINRFELGELKLKNGTFVEIKSNKSKDCIYASLFANSECEYGFIQIGRVLRLNLKCSLGETVYVKQIKSCPIANCVVFSPISDTVTNIEGKYSDLILNSQVINRINIIKKNQIIPIRKFNRTIEFKAVIVQPANVVIVERKEIFACRNTPVERRDMPMFNEICYDDIGGLYNQLLKIRQIIEIPLLQPKLFMEMKINKIKNILVVGEAGTGKSFLMESIKNETSAFCKVLDCLKLFPKTSEKAIKKLLKSIKKCVFNQPSIIIFDNIDIIALPNVSKDGDSDPRLSSAMISAIKRLKYEENIVTIATVRDISKLGNAFKNYFERTIYLFYPNDKQRFEVLRALSRKISIIDEMNIDNLVLKTELYTPSQIEMYCNELMLGSMVKVIENHKKKDHKFNITELKSIIFPKDDINNDNEYRKTSQERNLYSEFDSFLEVVKPIRSKVQNSIKIKNYFDDDLYLSNKENTNNLIHNSDNDNKQPDPFQKIKNRKCEMMPKNKDPFGLFLDSSKYDDSKKNIEHISKIKKEKSHEESSNFEKRCKSDKEKKRNKNHFQEYIDSSLSEKIKNKE